MDAKLGKTGEEKRTFVRIKGYKCKVIIRIHETKKVDKSF